MFIMKHKLGGRVERGTRVLANGYIQASGINHGQTFALVAKMNSYESPTISKSIFLKLARIFTRQNIR